MGQGATPPAVGLRAESLSLKRGFLLLFSNLSFTLSSGEALVLRGANGSGKTSLLRVLAGLTQPDDGAIYWQQQKLTALGEVARTLMFYSAHANAIKDELTAAENLVAALQIDGLTSSGDVYARSTAALAEVGLAQQADVPAQRLSQGQKRRIGLARLVCCDKPIWLLDEPTNALDQEGVLLFRHLVERHLEAGGSACIATHLELSLRRSTVQTELRLALP